MAYTYCKRCNILFDRSGKPYCADCEERMNKEYEKIIEYIKKNPNAMVIDIIADTGVSLKTINILVEEGYVSYKEAEKEIDNFELTKKLQKVINKGKFHLSINEIVK